MRFGGAKTLCTLTISIATFGITGLVVMLSIMIFISNMLSIKAFGTMTISTMTLVTIGLVAILSMNNTVHHAQHQGIWHYVKQSVAFLFLSVIMLNVVMLSVVAPSGEDINKLMTKNTVVIMPAVILIVTFNVAIFSIKFCLCKCIVSKV